MKICKEPFENIEITHNGFVFFCCAHNVQFNYIGNIYNQSFDEIWNSGRAVEIRTKILNNDYSCCNPKFCYRLSDTETRFEENEEKYTPVAKKFPLRIKLMHDNECNVNCIFCRKEIYRNTNEEIQKYDKLIDTMFIPLLQNAILFNPNASGDSFASRHSRKLIKETAKKYPNIKFEILTNGILATPSIIQDLGIENKMETVFVSFHATTESTYNKIVHNGNFNMVMKNIEYLSKIHNNGKLKYLQFSFVVNKYNYHEMIDFIHLARKYNARPSFWEVRNYNEDLSDSYKDLAVHLSTHPEHQKLLKILKDPIFDELKSYELFPALAELRKKH